MSIHARSFPSFFKRGLNVSLSTDDPLMLHYTKDPLLEEYSVARQVYSLSSTDVCEIARNSVLQSGFEHTWKAHFLGEDYWREGKAGNTMNLTNVPDQRVDFRHHVLEEERSVVARGAVEDGESRAKA